MIYSTGSLWGLVCAEVAFRPLCRCRWLRQHEYEIRPDSSSRIPDLSDGILFDIDWQGTQQLEGNKYTGKDLVSVFILPPNKKELEVRLRKRGQDTDEEVRKRMAKAADEMSHYREYKYIFVNHEIDESVKLLQIILGAERLRIDRQSGLHDFVQNLRDSI